jgi:hypothetical protein
METTNIPLWWREKRRKKRRCKKRRKMSKATQKARQKARQRKTMISIWLVMIWTPRASDSSLGSDLGSDKDKALAAK